MNPEKPWESKFYINVESDVSTELQPVLLLTRRGVTFRVEVNLVDVDKELHVTAVSIDTDIAQDEIERLREQAKKAAYEQTIKLRDEVFKDF